MVQELSIVTAVPVVTLTKAMRLVEMHPLLRQLPEAETDHQPGAVAHALRVLLECG